MRPVYSHDRIEGLDDYKAIVFSESGRAIVFIYFGSAENFTE
ncbi:MULTISPECIES: hypothetical protein [unclassified Microcoleus]